MNLIKILIVNFYYDLLMPSTVLCSNFTKERRLYEWTYVWTCFVYNYILVSSGLLRASTSLFLFSILVP